MAAAPSGALSSETLHRLPIYSSVANAKTANVQNLTLLSIRESVIVTDVLAFKKEASDTISHAARSPMEPVEVKM